MMPLVLALILAAYLIGGLSGGLLLGRLLGKGDLRTAGSGNAGATNALRTGGRGFGLAVLAFDLCKGMVAAVLLPYLPASASASAPAWLGYACGAGAVVGHVYPVYFGFRGGKGAATLIGVLLALVPLFVLPGAVVWLATVAVSGFVGLATVLGMTAVALALAIAHWPAFGAAPVVFGLAMWLLIVYTHRGNLRRVLAGTENRFGRLMLFRRGS